MAQNNTLGEKSDVVCGKLFIYHPCRIDSNNNNFTKLHSIGIVGLDPIGIDPNGDFAFGMNFRINFLLQNN